MWEVIVLVSVVVSAVCLVIIAGSLRLAVRRLDELTQTFHQFRGSLNDIINSQRDAIQASLERTEVEAARSLMQKDNSAEPAAIADQPRD
jgi:hypothetical protein